MSVNEFGITEDGRLYRLVGHRWTLFGHISGVLREETPLGRDVHAWWQARLASDERIENLVVPQGGDKSYFVQAPVPETALVSGLSPDQELAGAVLAGD